MTVIPFSVQIKR